MNRIDEFVKGYIPDNLSKKRTAQLRDELTCHLLDKADFYMEIGYTQQESISKAMADFGDEDFIRSYVSKEFEELYSEKRIYALLAFIYVAALNFLCFYLDLWVLSFDSNREPDGISAFGSFVIIFSVILLCFFARVRKYRKSLIAIGVVSFLTSVTMYWCMYPQMAGFTICYDALYLIDHLTPFCVGNIAYSAYEGTIGLLISLAIPMIISLYCFIQAFRIIKGRAGDIPQWGKKLAVFSAVFLAVSLGASLLCEKSEHYIDNYPRWFYEQSSYPSYSEEQMLKQIPLGLSYEQACRTLRSNGYYTLADYKNLVDPLTRKQFTSNLRMFDFEENYEIWYKPKADGDEYWGQGLLGIIQKNGAVVGIGIGCLEKEMYKGRYYDFSFADWNYKYNNMPEMKAYFLSLEKGGSEEEIIGKYRRDFGIIYSKRYCIDKGILRSYYRIYSYGRLPQSYEESFESMPSYISKNGRIYTELSFKDGEFVSGKIYETTYDENFEIKIVAQSIKKQ